MVNVFDSYSLVTYAENYGGVTAAVNNHGIFVSVDVLHQEGFMVALPGSEKPQGMLYAPRVEEFVRSRPLIANFGPHFLGIWLKEEYDEYEWNLEESVWVEQYADAIRYAKLWDQKYIWDIFNSMERKVED